MKSELRIRNQVQKLLVFKLIHFLSLEIGLAEFCFSGPISLDRKKARFRAKSKKKIIIIKIVRFVYKSHC